MEVGWSLLYSTFFMLFYAIMVFAKVFIICYAENHCWEETAIYLANSSLELLVLYAETGGDHILETDLFVVKYFINVVPRLPSLEDVN